jgi:SAM-dependent methyltransferase
MHAAMLKPITTRSPLQSSCVRRLHSMIHSHKSHRALSNLHLANKGESTCRSLDHQRRPFFSLLWNGDNDNTSAHAVPSTVADPDAAERKEQTIMEEALYRMSMQHGHPLGPWQAILAAVQIHYERWTTEQTNKKRRSIMRNSGQLSLAADSSELFTVLDLACGPRGQPGTSIAHALPLASVICTDSCATAVAAVGVFQQTVHDAAAVPVQPPQNLSTAIVDLIDLSSYASNSLHVITCCYGYGLASDLSRALAEAHRVLVPGGQLIIATWERSAMLMNNRDVLASIRLGGRDIYAEEDDEAFLPPRVSPTDMIALSGPGEFEGHLIAAGFAHPGAVITTMGTYPFNLGNVPAAQFAMGTILIRADLHNMGALASGSVGAGGWRNLAEEVFWMNIHRYTSVDVDGDLILADNCFKLTISTKAKQEFEEDNCSRKEEQSLS